MTIEELRMVNRICAYMQRAENLDYQTAYSFALAVVNNKEYIGRELNKESEDECQDITYHTWSCTVKKLKPIRQKKRLTL